MLPVTIQRSASLLFISFALVACGPDLPPAGLSADVPTPAGEDLAIVVAGSTPAADVEAEAEADPGKTGSTPGESDESSLVDPAPAGEHPVQSGSALASSDTPDAYRPLEDVRTMQQPGTTQRKPLDLSLPTMNWETDDVGKDFNSQRMPDVFRYQKTESGMNLSGKLHWDEDEEATRMSLEESIKGAEVELQFRLP